VEAPDVQRCERQRRCHRQQRRQPSSALLPQAPPEVHRARLDRRRRRAREVHSARVIHLRERGVREKEMGGKWVWGGGIKQREHRGVRGTEREREGRKRGKDQTGRRQEGRRKRRMREWEEELERSKKMKRERERERETETERGVEK
jgi:hypothetical protein